MPTSTKLNNIKVHEMPKAVHKYFSEHNQIHDNEFYVVDSPIPNATISDNNGYGICFEWADGNTSKQDRTGRFVQYSESGYGTNSNKIKFANQGDKVCLGITTNTPAFVDNGSIMTDYTSVVGVFGIFSVIDNGTCTVGNLCMSNGNGYAVPSNSTFGYTVVERVNATTIKVFVKPSMYNSDSLKDATTEKSYKFGIDNGAVFIEEL